MNFQSGMWNKQWPKDGPRNHPIQLRISDVHDTYSIANYTRPNSKLKATIGRKVSSRFFDID